jgi:Family of unknown function (DUF6227)
LNGQHETTETHIRQLLDRSLNSFDLPETVIRRLDHALAHASSMASAHHSKGRHRETYRHTYLLADGSTLTLWEVAYSVGATEPSVHELYAAEADACLAAFQLLGPESALDASGLENCYTPWDSVTAPLSPMPRLYVPDNSSDHGRRLLRRAENPDRPGEETAALLHTAFAHHIAQVFGQLCSPQDATGGFMLYEHAFLLVDGTELSLWEIEHTATPDGRHMCEVYAEEDAARAALETRARVR